MWLFNSIVIINENGKEIKIHNKKEAMFMAEQWLKISNDCANLVNTTKKTEVFFSRYLLLIEELEKLSKLESFNCFTGKPPSKNLKEILSKKEYTIDEFIDRFYNETLYKVNLLKTQKAKDKKIENFYLEFQKYNYLLSEKHLMKIKNLYLKLKEDNV